MDEIDDVNILPPYYHLYQPISAPPPYFIEQPHIVAAHEATLYAQLVAKLRSQLTERNYRIAELEAQTSQQDRMHQNHRYGQELPQDKENILFFVIILVCVACICMPVDDVETSPWPYCF